MPEPNPMTIEIPSTTARHITQEERARLKYLAKLDERGNQSLHDVIHQLPNKSVDTLDSE